MTKKPAAAAKKPKPATTPKAAVTPARGAEPEVVDRTFLPALTEQRLNFADKPLTLSREALLLNPRAFDVVRAAADPFRRGFVILGIIWLVVAVSRAVQLLLGFLTLPRLDVLATQVLERISALDWYAAEVAADPAFAQRFNAAYDAAWQLVRIVGGFPSATGIGTSILTLTLSLFGGWLAYGAVAHLFARWFGGQATYREFLGPLALAYAPMLLLALRFLPGFSLATTLVFLFMLATKYLAIRRTYALSPGYSLVVLLVPYLVGIIVIAILTALGVGLGLGEIPYLDPIVRFFTGV